MRIRFHTPSKGILWFIFSGGSILICLFNHGVDNAVGFLFVVQRDIDTDGDCVIVAGAG